MFTNIVGLDISLTSTGFSQHSMLTNETITMSFGSKNSKDIMMKRQKHIFDSINPFLTPRSLVVIEGYSYGSHNNAEVMAELCGVIKYCMYNTKQIIPFVITPQTLKKFITGIGKGDKSRIRVGAYKKWGIDFKTDDEIDAYGLMEIGKCIYCYFSNKLPRKYIKYEEECLNTIMKKSKINQKVIEYYNSISF